MSDFTPKLFTLLKQGIPRSQVVKDLFAGTVVGIVALPLAIAFAIASGVSPDKGLITAIVAGFIISLLGGSRVQIGGPTGAFIVVVFGVVEKYGVEGLTIATLIGGVMIVMMGLLRLGSLLKFVPLPLIVGFTSGIAVIIFSSQVKDFFGFPMDDVPASFFEKWKAYGRALPHINYYALGVGVISAIISLYFHRITRKIPGPFAALVLATGVVYFFQLPVDTIGSRFGAIPSTLALPSMPHLDLDKIGNLLQPAIAIALLGSIESLLSAVVADGMIGGNHRSNGELVAQGAANIASSLFGGIPATGAIARTATNVKNGGRTPIAGITHALVLLLIMLLFAPLAKLIPLACLAGILIVVAYHMSEWRHFLELLNSNRLDVLVLVTTFLLTVIFDLIIAIEVGLVLSSFMIMKRMSDTMTVQSGEKVLNGSDEKLFEEELPAIPPGVVLYEIQGALFFGAAQKFQDLIREIHSKPRVIILRMRHVPFIDATATKRIKDMIKHFEADKVHVILSGVTPSVRDELERSGIYDVLDRRNLLSHVTLSLKRAHAIMNEASGA
ncbi:MAG: SulP family inorganic anion transporter [Cyclobacteriaceae bacterium]